MTAAIAAPNPLAVRAGLDLVEAGGSAVDAAIAAMVVAMSTEPGVVSPLGGAYITVWPSNGEPEVVDGNVEMPGRTAERARFGGGLVEITTPYGGGTTLYAGVGSVATPGAFAGMGLAHERHGRATWREVLAPAVAVTRAGYPLGTAAASYLALTGQSLFGWDPDTDALLNHPDGSPRSAGEVIVDDNLSAALDRIGEYGADDLYRGALARSIAEDQANRGGLIGYDDLFNYRAVVRPALRLRAGHWDLATNPPPSIGGPVLSVMLRELQRRGRWSVGDLIEIQRAVLGHRRRTHDFSRDLEADGYDLLDEVERHGLVGLPSSSSTAHVSVVDDSGMACAITASAGYGSGATVPGTGLMLNNCLGEPELNRLGLHALAPGTRLASNMAPTVARSDEGEVLAIGSPGADRITTALLQVLGRHLFPSDEQGSEAVDLPSAIDAPRVHVSFSGDFPAPAPAGASGSASEPDPVVQYEDDPQLAAAVAASGLASVPHPRRSMFFGGVGAAVRLTDGTLSAAADLRRESATGVG